MPARPVQLSDLVMAWTGCATFEPREVASRGDVGEVVESVPGDTTAATAGSALEAARYLIGKCRWVESKGVVYDDHHCNLYLEQ